MDKKAYRSLSIKGNPYRKTTWLVQGMFSIVFVISSLPGIGWGEVRHDQNTTSIHHLTILHTSEHHGTALPLEQMGQPRVGGLAARATLIATLQQQHSDQAIVVDSGDILIGSALSSFFRGELDIKAMNMIGYHAMAAGNHDFDFGIAHLAGLQRLADFPILCTNIMGESLRLPCRSATVLSVGGLKVGVIGLLGHGNFPDSFNRQVVKQLDLGDPMETARQVSRDLRNTEGVDLIIAITHMDTQEDLALLAQVSEVDVIIGGHTVGFDGLRTPNLPGAIPKLQHPGRVFVKTHRQGRTVGRLELEIAKPSQGRVKILHATSENIAVDHTLALNPGVAELIEAYDRKLDAEADVVLGRTLVHLRGATEQVRSQETNLGNLLADILRERFGAEVALVNAGQIRGSIPPGPVNFRRVLSVLPFDSPTCTLTLTGTQIRRALENSVSRLPSLNGRFLQVSGLSFAFDPSQLPGQRVQGINVGTAPLIPSRRYTVALPTFLAEGGDGYGVLGAGENRINRGVPMRDLFLEALQQGPIKASVGGRIQRSGMPPLLR